MRFDVNFPNDTITDNSPPVSKLTKHKLAENHTGKNIDCAYFVHLGFCSGDFVFVGFCSMFWSGGNRAGF